MRLEKAADTRSPWYEAFAPAIAAGKPTLWVVTPSEPPAPAKPDARATDEDWVIEALFDYYNGQHAV